MYINTMSLSEYCKMNSQRKLSYHGILNSNFFYVFEYEDEELKPCHFAHGAYLH